MGFFENLVKKIKGLGGDISTGAKEVGTEIHEEYNEHTQGRQDPDEKGNPERHQFENEFDAVHDKWDDAKDVVSEKATEAKEFMSEKADDAKEYLGNKFEDTRDFADDKIADAREEAEKIGNDIEDKIEDLRQ